jgi:proteasome accessory factor A
MHPEKGLYYELENQGHTRRVTNDQQLDVAIQNAPEDTRAKARTQVMRYLFQNRLPCIVDWHQIYFTHEEPFEMKNPFNTYGEEVDTLLKKLSRHPRFSPLKKRSRS